jgi:hypothetical protein
MVTSAQLANSQSFLRFDLRKLDQDRRWQGWQRWPLEDNWISIYLPPSFKTTRAYTANDDNGIVFDVRLRSPDGKAEFAVSVAGVSQYVSSISARQLPWVRFGSHESVVEHYLSGLQSAGDSSVGYEEDFTVINAHPTYTRYFKRSFSMSNQWLAESFLWEFKVANDATRLKYQALYRQFKECLIELSAD